MKLYFKTKDPKKLKEDIIDLIENKELQTWSIHEDNDRKYLKHTKQWGEKGVIQLTTEDEFIISEVLRFKSITDKVKDFEGYYLGRFCELIFVNFPNKFTTIEKK